MPKYEKYKDVFGGKELMARKELLIEMAKIVGMNDLEKENWIKSWEEKEVKMFYYLSDEEKVWLDKVCMLWTNRRLCEKERKIIRKVIIKAIKKNTCFFAKEFNNDREIVLETVKKYGSLLRNVSKELRNDKKIVLIAVKNHQWALEYASEELQNDKEIVLEAIRYDENVIQYASKKIRSDPEIILKVTKNKGDTLQYLSKEVQDDREIVLVAVKNRGYALKFASKRLRNDREILKKAYKKKYKDKLCRTMKLD